MQYIEKIPAIFFLWTKTVRNILRVHMASRECRYETMPEYAAGLGGRGLAVTLAAGEIDPATDPLGEGNKLIFSPGLLAGTQCANSDRVSVVFKSPMTGRLKEANAGGQVGGHLARLGIAALVIEAAVPDGTWLQLELDTRGARLVPSTVVGLNNYSAVESLVRQHGRGCSHISIGRAGEFCLPAADIVFTDRALLPSRHAGRGGAGAVMGSKGLKSVTINPEGSSPPVVRDERLFQTAARQFAGILVVQAEQTENDRFFRGCGGCVIQCLKADLSAGKKHTVTGKWPGFEKFWRPDSGLEISDLTARYCRICDDVGIDALEMDRALALMCDAGVLRSGDVMGAMALLEEIGQGSRMGRLLGGGTAAINVEYPWAAHGYAESARSHRPSHCAGHADPQSRSDDMRAFDAAADTLGLCFFAALVVRDNPAALVALTDMVKAMHGSSLTPTSMEELGKGILAVETDFNEVA